MKHDLNKLTKVELINKIDQLKKEKLEVKNKTSNNAQNKTSQSPTL
jgi:hypothetical protein